MSTRTNTIERNGHSNKGAKTISVWSRAITSNSEWTDKVNKNAHYLLNKLLIELFF